MREREWQAGPQWLADSRAEWEPALAAARRAWEIAELASITAGIREAALVNLEPDEIPIAQRDCLGIGLELSILDFHRGRFRAAVHGPGLAAAWRTAWYAQDHQWIGAMLGFPECCRAFFAREWGSTDAPDVSFRMRSFDGPWEANTALRYAGVRLVPHLPCSAECEPTIRLGRQFLSAAIAGGADVASLEAILRLPVRHDALNGVAIVETPHFRYQARTVRGERGILRRAGAAEPATWTDNGFGNVAIMDAAHDALVSLSRAAISALDLGCGDGRLLWRLANGRPGLWAGVESQAPRAERGRRRYGIAIATGGIQDGRWVDDRRQLPVDVAFVMPGRLVEMGEAAGAATRAWLRASARRVVAYCYDGGFSELMRGASMVLAGPTASSGCAEAAEVTL